MTLSLLGGGQAAAYISPMADDNYDPDPLPPAAQRALAEAAERRKAEEEKSLPKEFGGRDGPEPVRFGDWEKKGIAIDF
ncbi:MAG: DUF1674 domain-containing protein [Pseudomonadota bacterium]